MKHAGFSFRIMKNNIKEMIFVCAILALYSLMVMYIVQGVAIEAVAKVLHRWRTRCLTTISIKIKNMKKQSQSAAIIDKVGGCWSSFCKYCISKKWNDGRRKVEMRHAVLDRRVKVESILMKCGLEWKRKFFINMDGVRILPYNPDSMMDVSTYKDIREAYYKAKRHTFLKK